MSQSGDNLLIRELVGVRQLVDDLLTRESPVAGAAIPAPHAPTHEHGGSDEIDVTGLLGTLADPQTPLLHAISHENGGGDEMSLAGLSGLLADPQTPLAHNTSHENGGADEINVAGLSGRLADPQNADTLQGVAINATPPTTGQALVHNGTEYVATDIATQAELNVVAAGRVTAVTASAPLASSGGLTPNIALSNQAANLVLAGPVSGGAAAPSFRALVAADILPINLASTANGGITGILAGANGGTGVNNGAFTLTLPASGTAALRSTIGTADTITMWDGANTIRTADGLTYDRSIGFLSTQSLLLGTATPGARLHVTEADAATSNISTVAIFQHNSTATPLAGFGSAVVFYLKSSTTADQTAAEFNVAWADPTHATRTSQIDLRTVVSGVRGTRVSIGTTSTAANVAIPWVSGAALPALYVGAATAGNNQNAIKAESNSTAAIYGLSQSGAGVRADTVSGNAFVGEVADAGTTNIANGLLIRHASSGTPATGFGIRIAMQGTDSGGTMRDIAWFNTTWATATSGSRKGQFDLIVYDTAARTVLTGGASGTVPMIGFLGAAAIARPAAYTLSGSATRVFPTDPSAAYTGINNAQAGTVYATVADVNTLRGIVSTLLGVVRQGWTDLGDVSGFGLFDV